jgi:regulatory protein
MKMDKETYLKFFSKAAAYCSLAEHCQHEVREKMKAWEVPEEMVDNIIDHLKEEQFIDEERYCRAFVDDKLKHNKWGCIKIRYELLRKRIPSDLIIEVFSNLDEEEYLAMAKSLMEKKRKEIKAKDDYERRNKLYRFMAGRGFELEITERAYAALMAE